jgi:hypothetical protein
VIQSKPKKTAKKIGEQDGFYSTFVILTFTKKAIIVTPDSFFITAI